MDGKVLWHVLQNEYFHEQKRKYGKTFAIAMCIEKLSVFPIVYTALFKRIENDKLCREIYRYLFPTIEQCCGMCYWPGFRGGIAPGCYLYREVVKYRESTLYELTAHEERWGPRCFTIAMPTDEEMRIALGDLIFKYLHRRRPLALLPTSNQ